MIENHSLRLLFLVWTENLPFWCHNLSFGSNWCWYVCCVVSKCHCCCLFACLSHTLFTQILLIQTIFTCLLAIPIYKFIVKQRPCGTQQYLFGFGIVIPIACWIPFQLLQWLNVQNCVLKMSFATLPSIVVFRCIEAMFDTSLNTAVEASLTNYVTYYSSLVNAVWDTKTNKRVQVTASEVLSHIWTILSQYVILSILLSYLSATNYQPFPSTVQLDQFQVTLELLQPGQLLNNYLVGLLTLYTLCVGFNLTGFLNNIQGYSVVDVLYCPMFCTKSVGDFWRSKWNPVIGGALKVSDRALKVIESIAVLYSHVSNVYLLPPEKCIFAGTKVLFRVSRHSSHLFHEWTITRLFLGLHLLQSCSSIFRTRRMFGLFLSAFVETNCLLCLLWICALVGKASRQTWCVTVDLQDSPTSDCFDTSNLDSLACIALVYGRLGDWRSV